MISDLDDDKRKENFHPRAMELKREEMSPFTVRCAKLHPLLRMPMVVKTFNIIFRLLSFI